MKLLDLTLLCFKKSRKQETRNVLTDADSITIAMKRKRNLMGCLYFFEGYNILFYGGSKVFYFKVQFFLKGVKKNGGGGPW